MVAFFVQLSSFSKPRGTTGNFVLHSAPAPHIMVGNHTLSKTPPSVQRCVTSPELNRSCPKKWSRSEKVITCMTGEESPTKGDLITTYSQDKSGQHRNVLRTKWDFSVCFPLAFYSFKSWHRSLFRGLVLDVPLHSRQHLSVDLKQNIFCLNFILSLVWLCFTNKTMSVFRAFMLNLIPTTYFVWSYFQGQSTIIIFFYISNWNIP